MHNYLMLAHSFFACIGVLLNELWNLFQGLADDSQDSVRLLSVDVALALGEALPVKAVNEQLLPITLKLTCDRSWRVRYLVGASFTGLTERIFSRAPPGKVDAVGLFCALLGDLEAEVRTAAARQLSSTCALFPALEFQSRILPVLRQLASDASVSVRSAVATQLNPLSAIAGAELASTSLFPLYTHFFADESSQVRLNAVSKMDVVCDVMGVERVAASILPAIVHLAEDKQWRVREAVIEHLPTLSQHLVSSRKTIFATNSLFLLG
jgi:serine/threonine-protein phosphatase 2A regulatory subunit A